MNKKLIGFNEEQLEKIEAYAKNQKMSFTQAVRVLCDIALSDAVMKLVQSPQAPSEGGLPTEMDRVLNDLRNLTDRMDKIENDRQWWNTDDIQSRVGNIEVKLNTVVKVSKLLKAHMNDKEIHLQDR